MDEDVALAPTADDNTGLAPEVRAYAGAWSRFREWTAGRGFSSLPADPAILILYLEHLVQEGRAKTTIRTAAPAAGGRDDARRDLGHPGHRPDPQEGPGRTDGKLGDGGGPGPSGRGPHPPGRRPPGIRGRGPHLEGRGALGRRVGQAPSSGQRPTRRARGAVVAVTPACLRALDAIRPENPGDGDRVFRLSIRQMANRIKDAVAAAGFDGDVFSGHSGRVGLARMMSGAGAPTETTMRQGRWKSAEMVRRYTRAETAGAALQWMDGGT